MHKKMHSLWVFGGPKSVYSMLPTPSEISIVMNIQP